MNTEEPRFYVTSVRGWPTIEGGKSSTLPRIFYVLDRAYAHQVIAEFDEAVGDAGERRRQATQLARWLNSGRPKGDRCGRGHLRTVANTRINTRSDGSPHRICLLCKRITDRRFYLRQKRKRGKT